MFRPVLALTTALGCAAGPLGYAPAANAAPAGCGWLLKGTYYLQNPSGKVLDVRGNQTANGSAVQTWSLTRGRNQQWRRLQWSCAGMGGEALQSVASNKCLDVSLNRPIQNGNQVQLYQCHYQANQRWWLISPSAQQPYQVLKSWQHLDYVVDAAAPGSNGGRVQVWNYGSAVLAHVRWRLVSV